MKSDAAAPDPRTGRLAAAMALAALALAYALYASQAVPRLTNNLVGDSEFTGWTGPIAERFFRGEVPYRDFVLPIPPGSFVVLALAGRAFGERLLTELTVNAVCHFGMASLAYSMSRAWASRATSFAVAAATLATVVQLYKECAYDHTAQLVAWGSMCAGAYALCAQSRIARRNYWLLTGALAGFTLAFKQSTGLGVLLGWSLALGLAVILALRRRNDVFCRRLLHDARAYALGVGVGLLLLLVLVLFTGSSLSGFVQAVFLDGTELKGGRSKLLQNLFSYVFRFEAWPASFGLTLLCVWLFRRISRRDPSFNLAAPDDASPARFMAVATISVVAFLGAAWVLTRGDALPTAWIAWAERMKYVPTFGLVALCFMMVWRMGATVAVDGQPVDPALEPTAQRAQSLVMLGLAAFVCSLLHNLSSPNFRPFYDNNAIIPVAFLLVFKVFEHARLGRLVPVVLALSLGVLFSTKMSLHLEATEKVQEGHWAGLLVNERGLAAVAAASRARQLAGSGTVLVLPEDVAFARLVARPRPDIRGAIVFVDQYPRRLLADDLASLERDPPRVVVLNPAKSELWRAMYGIWNSRSAAHDVNLRFIEEWLPARYVLDSVHPTRFARTRAEMQIWVLKD